MRNQIRYFFLFLSVCISSEVFAQPTVDWNLVTNHSMPARYGHSMVYNSKEKRLVSFTGYGDFVDPRIWVAATSAVEDDEYNFWKAADSVGPFPRQNYGFSYDSSRQVLVLFSGMISIGSRLLGETWELSSTGGWRCLNNCAVGSQDGPSARVGHAMIYDNKRKRHLLFGGKSGAQFFNDMWEWNGSHWTQISLSNAPSARWGHMMVYDVTRDRIVLFGGSNSTEFFNDTWEWDGRTWAEVNQRTNSIRPSVRHFGAMVYNSDLHLSILFGGGRRNPPQSSDTWIWNGQNWKSLETVHRPPARDSMAMAYDEENHRVVMNGGFSINNSNSYMPDTWELKWTR